MHRRGARKGNQNANIYRNRTPCAHHWFFRVTSPVPPYLRRNGDNIRPLLSKRDQTGTRGCGCDPKYGPQLLGRARDPPSKGPEAPGLPHHLAPRLAPAARRRAAYSPGQTERRFRTRPLRHSNFAPAAAGPGRRQDSPSPNSGSSSSHRSPAVLAVVFAIARARRGQGKRDGGSGRGCRRRGVVLSCAVPSRPGRGGREGHCGRGASVRLRGALRCLGQALPAGLRPVGRGLRGRSGQGRGGAGL